MAIEYSFVLDTPEAPANLARWLETHLSMQADTDSTHPARFSPGIHCTVLRQSETGQDLIRETFDIGSTVTILCRIDKFDDQSTGMRKLIEICLALLTHFTVDMVLLAGGEQGKLLRKGSHITVDCRDDYWRTRWRSAFPGTGLTITEADLPLI